MQHPWSETVRLAVDLEAMGAGGKSSIFQVKILNFIFPLASCQTKKTKKPTMTSWKVI